MAEAWHIKEGSPLAFSLGEAFLATVTGDPAWAWLGAYIPLMGERVVDTTAFCAAGPPPPVDIDITDFLTGNRNPVAGTIDQLRLLGKLGLLAESRIFAAYCEFHSDAGETCTVFATATANHLGDSRYFFDAPVPIPAGVKRLKTKVISWGSGTNDLHIITYQGGGVTPDITFPDQNFMAVNQVTTHDWTVALTDLHFYSNAIGSVFEFSWCTAGSEVPHEPDEPVEPPDLPPPVVRDYPDLDAIGAELDRQELKLDFILAQIRSLVVAVYLPVQPALEPVEILPNVPVALSQAGGVVITLFDVPPSVSEDFGVPPLLHKAGRLTFQTDDGYMESVEITHSPFVVQPLPPGVTNVIVDLIPPTTATLTVLPQST